MSKHQIQPGYGDEQTDAGRDCRTCLARSNSQARTGTGIFFFSPFSADHERAGLATLKTKYINRALKIKLYQRKNSFI